MSKEILNRMLRPLRNYAMRHMEKNLKAYGLRYEDVLIETPELMEAVARLSPEEREMRMRRQRRAFDLSLKRKELPKHLQDAMDPFESYLADALKEVEQEKKDKRELSF